MAQYIDKDILVAEIKKRLKHNGTRAELDRSSSMAGRENEDKDILSFLDTLEVKEADLEKELDYNDYTSFFKEHPDYSNRDWGFDECWVFAEYFYKLGLKAKGG